MDNTAAETSVVGGGGFSHRRERSGSPKRGYRSFSTDEFTEIYICLLDYTHFNNWDAKLGSCRSGLGWLFLK